MRKCTKVLSAIITATMILTSICGTAFAASDDDVDYSIGGLSWDDTEFAIKALWDKAESKTSYKVVLYRSSISSSNKVASKDTSSDSVDFTSNIINKGSGTYYFTVSPTKEKSIVEESEALYLDSEEITSIKNNRSSSSSSTASSTTSTGSAGPGVSSSTSSASASSGWVLNSNGKWTYSENNVLFQSGWKQISNNWYFFENGFMDAAQWIESPGDGRYYYVDGSGAMCISQWIISPGDQKYYYVGSDGAMLLNTVTPDGYRVDANGVWVQ